MSASDSVIQESIRRLAGNLSVKQVSDKVYKIDASTQISSAILTLYADIDRNKNVTGTKIPAKYLKIFKLNQNIEPNRWELVQNQKEPEFEQNRVKVTATIYPPYSYFTLIAFKSPEELVEGLMNYPNPFYAGTETNIVYHLKQDADVTIRIFNLVGDLVYEEHYSRGEEGGRESVSTGVPNKITWDGRNAQGSKVATGAYILQLEAKTDSEKKVVYHRIGVKK